MLGCTALPFPLGKFCSVPSTCGKGVTSEKGRGRTSTWWGTTSYLGFYA